MPTPKALYTPESCHAAYQLRWSLCVFWTCQPPAPGRWMKSLREATEADGVRILEHHLQNSVSQFLVSTRPEIAPPRIAQSVKGRLRYLVSANLPKPFRRNYHLQSVGKARREDVAQYVRTQLQRQGMADARVQDRLKAVQISEPGVDLSAPRLSGHAQYCYNLHLVLVCLERAVEIRPQVLQQRRETILGVAKKKGHLLAEAGILADHLHLTIGCQLAESPQEVALSYLNNLAYVEGMKAIYEHGFYTGTIGEYDLSAVRRRLRDRD